MKKLTLLLIVVLLVSVFSGCSSKVKLDEGERVTLYFSHEETDFHRTLTEEESETVINILQGKRACKVSEMNLPEYEDAPAESAEPHSCEFTEDIAISIGDQTFAMSRDECTMLQDWESEKLIILSQRERDEIIALFEKYGGYFPCI